MYFDGRSDIEIGRALNRTSRSIRRFAELRGFRITRSKVVRGQARLDPARRQGRPAPPRRSSRQTPAAAIEQLVGLLLSDEAEIARRMPRNGELARQAIAEAFGATRGKTAA